jgi:MFS family permease
MKRMPSWYWAFGVINIALGIFSQLLPLYAYFLGAKAREVGLLAAVGSATTIVASLFWGKIADATTNRRSLVLFGFFSLVLGYGLLAFLRDVGPLYALNAGVTFFWMAAGTASTLLVLATFPRAQWERELGLFNAVSGVGWTLGLILGARLDHGPGEARGRRMGPAILSLGGRPDGPGLRNPGATLCAQGLFPCTQFRSPRVDCGHGDLCG